MNTFDKYFGKSDAELNASTKELCFRKVKRGFESAVDQLETEKLRLQENIMVLKIALANGDIGVIPTLLEALADKEAADMAIALAKKESEEFIGSDGATGGGPA